MDFGYTVLYPDGLVVQVAPDGAAARAGLRLGDRVVHIDGTPPAGLALTEWLAPVPGVRERLVVRRSGRLLAIALTGVQHSAAATGPLGRRLGTGSRALGYVDLTSTSGTASYYVTQAQQLLRQVDRQPTCGWVIDLRRMSAGDLWSYLAAIGPILGQGNLGGFLYRNGTRQTLSYHSGAVLWDGRKRRESTVQGSVYALKRQNPPVALLIGRDTIAAGENVVVAFSGRPETRTFGEPTFGVPVYQESTALSDGAYLTASAAYAFDRRGHVYTGPIAPDVVVAPVWTQFNTARDPELAAATAWLRSQAACTR